MMASSRSQGKMSILRFCFIATVVGVLQLACWPGLAAETPTGCDGLSALPVEGFLSRPQNLSVIKQQLLAYRCAKKKLNSSDQSSGDTWNLAASTNCYGTLENATSEPKPGGSPQ